MYEGYSILSLRNQLVDHWIIFMVVIGALRSLQCCETVVITS